MTTMTDSMKAIKKQIDDRTIACDMLMASKAAASAYFMGVLESSTPEARAMFRSALSQTLDEYSVLMELSINRDWLKPYQPLEQQLLDAYKQSETVVAHQKA
jgi:spore coat protein CotF